MAKKKWLAVVLVLALFSSLAVLPAFAASQGNPAAPAIATQMLREMGIKGNFGQYISEVTKQMGPGATFDGIEKKDAVNYRNAIRAFLQGLVISTQRSSLDIRTNPAGERTKVLIGFSHKPGNAEANLVRAAGGNVRYVYDIIPSIAAELPPQAIAALERNPNVTMIEPDIEVFAISSADFTAELDRTWGVKHIGAGTVHNQGAFGTGIKVAVIDSGIDYRHGDIAANYKGGYNFVRGNNDPMDDNGHGTHVAGTIAAVRNGAGVVGAAPAVELYALKVLDRRGSGNYSNVIAALDWSVKNSIDITNNSYGSSGDPGNQVRQAFDNAYAAGILHVGSAGNNGTAAGDTNTVGYPARYSSVIAVAATDQDNKRPSWSSTGPDVEISAPGVSINSTIRGGGYGTSSGTSMASPHVAGVAALVWANGITDTNSNGRINDEVRQRLIETADNIGSAYQYGSGLVNAAAAVGSIIITPTTGTIAGKVTDNNNVPIAGAVITVTKTDYSITTTTHSDGRYTVSIPAGTYAVTAAKDGYHAVTRNNISVSGGATTTVDFNLGSSAGGGGGSITGVAVSFANDQTSYKWNSFVNMTVTVSGDGTAGAGVSLTIKDPGAKTVFTSTGTTDAGGKAYFSYRVPNKATIGSYAVEADCNGVKNPSTSFYVSGK